MGLAFKASSRDSGIEYLTRKKPRNFLILEDTDTDFGWQMKMLIREWQELRKKFKKLII